MTFARTAMVAVALTAMTAPLQSTLASTESKPVKQADFLFVRSARAMSYDKAGGKLTLHDVSPMTLFFSDRPDRIAGNMRTSAFVPFWSTGTNSFLSDPPNADISILAGVARRSYRRAVIYH
jgi:hypothetical protein